MIRLDCLCFKQFTFTLTFCQKISVAVNVVVCQKNIRYRNEMPCTLILKRCMYYGGYILRTKTVVTSEYSLLIEKCRKGFALADT